MLLLVAIVALACLAQWYLLTHGLDEVSFTQRTSATLVEAEEAFTIHSTMENRKRFLPVLLQVQERLPEDLSIVGRPKQSRVSLYRVRYYDYCQYLRRRDKVTRSYQATLPARGRYVFRGAVLKGNDFLGMQESALQIDTLTEVIVAPKRMESVPLEQMLGGFLGDVSVRRFMAEDPSLHTGFRSYTGREPMRSISWSQSAKGQGLLVKQYDYTTDPTVRILLSVEGGTPYEIEACYSLVRTLCETLEQKRIRYDFFTNAVVVGGPRACRHVGEGLGTQHLNTVLEGLGRATYHCATPLHTTLRRAGDALGEGSSILILPNAATAAAANAEVKRLFAHRGGVVRVLTPQEVCG